MTKNIFIFFQQNQTDKEALKREIDEVNFQIQYMIEENRDLMRQLRSALMMKNIAIIVAVLMTILFLIFAISFGSAFIHKVRMMGKIQEFDRM